MRRMKMVETHPQVMRNSRLFTRGPIDGRSREGRYLGRIRQELVRHLGGNPSPVERQIIDRVAMLQLKLAQLDEKATSGGLSEFELRAYTSLSSGLHRSLRALGIKGAPAKAPTLAEISARIARSRRVSAGEAAA